MSNQHQVYNLPDEILLNIFDPNIIDFETIIVVLHFWAFLGPNLSVEVPPLHNPSAELLNALWFYGYRCQQYNIWLDTALNMLLLLLRNRTRLFTVAHISRVPAANHTGTMISALVETNLQQAVFTGV
ncbi:hypothetical protein BDC45DRAFT_537541 [Circinella umbellata]|nr:hypothetical protein BDC45DRAFT_537541 [Circinella umbellata]